MRVDSKITKEYEALLRSVGEQAFYNRVLGSGVLSKRHAVHPEIVMLDQAQEFFALYRRTGNENYFTIGRILRRASHTLYREFHRECKYPVNGRFLNIVK
jgi:hypothetical protein